MKNIKTIRPLQCHLFRHDVTIKEASKPQLDTIKVYAERQQLDAHENSRSVLRCKACQQLYFYEFIEWIDYKAGNDPQYRKFIPIKSIKDGDALDTLDAFEITGIRPQLCIDWPDDEGMSIKWLV